MGSPEQVKTRFKTAGGNSHRLLRLWTSAAAGLALVLGFAPPLAMAEPQPSAREILRMVRASESSQDQSFSGKLSNSTSRGKVVVPLRLTMRGGTFTYQFLTPPPEALILRMGEKGSRLERATGSGRAQVVTGAKLDELVRGTDISYEDLAMKFLYWNNATVVGEQSLMTRHCWIVQALPSSREDSQYDMVRLWVEKTGGLLRAECYSGGKPVKRFDVRGVQRAPGGGYVLKTMTIQRLDASGRDRTPTRLELNPT